MTAPPAATPLGRRCFGNADQQLFAELSGDFNPMHMEAVAARRLLTGRQVVHGVHTLLCALEQWPADRPLEAWSFDADFPNPLSVGDEVVFTFDRPEAQAQRLVATVGALACCRIDTPAAVPSRPPLDRAADAERVTPGPQALEREPQGWVGRQQLLALPGADFAAAFPAAAARLGERPGAAGGGLWTKVGMVCPGLHSVFSSLSVQSTDDGGDELRFEVRRYDPRFRIFVIVFDGPLRGEIRAFLRAPAQLQASTTELRAQVRHDEFAGSRHWVIGGSRGLGELTSKLLAAGGAQVTLSYATGAADAQCVLQDIAAAGAPAAQARQLDLVLQGLDEWLRDAPWPDAVWYFATPRIFRKKAALFDSELFEEFVDFYVRRFEALCQALEAAAEGRTVRVFYPSTVFVDARPKGMTEYAMAKAAAEVLVTDLARTLRHVKPVARRLPRLATDQTAGLASGSAVSNSEVMLPVLRELMAG